MKIQRFEGVKGYSDRTLHMGGYSEKKQTYRNMKLFVIALLCLCILAALQTTLFSKIPLFILSTGSPALCLLFVMASGYVFGEKEGCVCGFFGGIISECVIMEPLFGGIMVLPLLYCIFGYVSGALSKKVLASNLPSFLIYAAVGSIANGFYGFILTALKIHHLPPMVYITEGLLPEWILTVAFSPLVYFFVRSGKRILDKNQ